MSSGTFGDVISTNTGSDVGLAFVVAPLPLHRFTKRKISSFASDVLEVTSKNIVGSFC